MQTLKRFKLPIYGVPIVFAAGIEASNRYGVDMPPHFGAMVCIADNDVLFALRDEYQYSSSTLCHESIHAAWRVCDLVGIEVTSANHEALAYLAGSIMKEAVKFFDKHYGNAEPKSVNSISKEEVTND